MENQEVILKVLAIEFSRVNQKLECLRIMAGLSSDIPASVSEQMRNTFREIDKIGDGEKIKLINEIHGEPKPGNS